MSNGDATRQVGEMILYGGEWDLLVAHVRLHAPFVDRFVVVESDATHSGERRDPVLESRRDELPLGGSELRIITLHQFGVADLQGEWARALAQRDAGFMGVADLPPDTVVLVSDVDEVLAPATFARLVRELDAPVRLQLDLRYQYLDRRAPGWPCCERHVPPSLRAKCPTVTDFTQPAVLACRRSDLGPLGPTSPSALRRRPSGQSSWVAGWHLSGVDPSSRLGRKEQVGAHVMSGRIVDTDHMRRCARAGVHHRGWWYVVAEDPARLGPELDTVAAAVPGACAPDPLPPERQRRALRAWAEVRQWDRVPDRLVASLDRRFDAPGPALVALANLVDAHLVRRALLAPAGTTTGNSGTAAPGEVVEH